MQSFNRKTKVDLPQIEKKQIQAYDKKEVDAFDLLFKSNKKEADLIDLKKNKKFKDIGNLSFFKDYRIYLLIAVLLIPACFLVVQVVTGGNEIDRYKLVTETIKNENSNHIDVSSENFVDESIPDIRFASSPPVKPKLLQSEVKETVTTTQKSETTKTITIVKAKQKPIVKPIKPPVHIAINNVRKNNPVNKIQASKTKVQVVQNKTQLKTDQAIADIMLRPLASSNIEQKPIEPILRRKY